MTRFVQRELGPEFWHDETQSCGFVAVRLAFEACNMPPLTASAVTAFVCEGVKRRKHCEAGMTQPQLIAFINLQRSRDWEVSRRGLKSSLFTGKEITHKGVKTMTAGGGVFLLGGEGQGFVRHVVTIKSSASGVLVGDDGGWRPLAERTWMDKKISSCWRFKIVKPFTDQAWTPTTVSEFSVHLYGCAF